MKLYSIYDSAAEAHMRPFVARSHGEALREFGNLAQDESHPVGQHPGDYTLFYHGTFDEWSGVLEAEPAKVALGNGLDYSAQGLKAVHDA